MTISMENIVFSIFSCIFQNHVVSVWYYHLPFLSNIETQVYYNQPSYIRKGKCRPATTTTPPVSRSGYPPWILKRAGLESSGRRLISSIGKTKGIAFCFVFSKFFFFLKIFRFFEKK